MSSVALLGCAGQGRAHRGRASWEELFGTCPSTSGSDLRIKDRGHVWEGLVVWKDLGLAVSLAAEVPQLIEFHRVLTAVGSRKGRGQFSCRASHSRA